MKRQLNIRVSTEAADALDAAVFVQGVRSVQEILGPLIERYAAQLREDASISAALELRNRHATARATDENRGPRQGRRSSVA